MLLVLRYPLQDAGRSTASGSSLGMWTRVPCARDLDREGRRKKPKYGTRVPASYLLRRA
jgi:hypothetical protein